MSELKATPGPWIVTVAHDEVSVAMGDAVDSPYEYTCGHLWQTVDVYWSEADEEDIANAHLIAAAPDLYEALEELIQLIEIERPDWQHKEQFRAIAALAKARGES